MQKRLVRKLDLELALTKVKTSKSPNVYLEQYPISAKLATEILYLAEVTYASIMEKKVVDLGCGTGRLAIGSAILGAKKVVGLDIDKTALYLAKKNAEMFGLKNINWINADVSYITKKFDTVLQNPPFGIQRRKADRQFIEKALEIGNSIYSLHKSSKQNQKYFETLKHQKLFVLASPSIFLEKIINSYGGEIQAVYTTRMTIPYMFSFHKKKKHEFLVDLYVIKTN